MGPRWIRFNLSIALVASLLAHGGLIIWTVHEQIAETFSALLAGMPAQVDEPSSSVAFTPPEEPKKESPFELDLELGDWNGTGTAIAEADGERPLAGRRGGQDQPLLSRDPVGQGRIGDAPTQYTGPIGRGGNAIAQLRESVADSAAGGPQVMPMHFPLQAPVVIKPRPDPLIGLGAAPTSQPAAGPTVIASAGGPTAQAAKSSDAPNRSADPGPMSDSEIDLFSKAAVVEFHQGKAKPQFGRRAKLTRPHIPLAGAIDAFGMGRSVKVALILNTDETGQVINARVAKGSGSNEIDNPVRREAYNWSFDPGEPDHPLPREFPIVVAIYD
jgi:TonB family protein